AIDGPGAIQSMWFTGRKLSRATILRIYWDDQSQPSVECPLADFFTVGWGPFAQVSSVAIAVNPNNGLNCFWEMPFRKNARLTLENRGSESVICYYQINYALTDIPEDAAYFHAQFRRTNPLPYKSVFTVLDGISGAGQYVGTYLAVGVTNNGWWGEGEIKFYLDGDTDFPTLCGTGTEDYFCGSYDFDTHRKNAAGMDVSEYTEFCSPYSGLPQVIRGDGHYNVAQRFGLYRWHIADPIRFEKSLKVTIQ